MKPSAKAPQADVAHRLRQSLSAQSETAATLFDQFSQRLIRVLVAAWTNQLVNERTLAELAALAVTIQTGRTAEEEMAKELRAWLHDLAQRQMSRDSAAHAASDVVQDACLSMVGWLLHSFNGTTDKEIWKAAATAFQRKRMDELSTSSARPPTSTTDMLDVGDDTNSASKIVSTQEQLIRFRSAIDALPEADRILLRLNFVSGWNSTQLAELIGANATAADIRKRLINLKLETVP